MIQINLLIVGIVYAIRRPNLKALKASRFPDVPQEVFAKWQTLELKSIDIFLWARHQHPGRIDVCREVSRRMDGSSDFHYHSIVLTVVSTIPGSKAAKLKRLHGIKWPKLSD
jgi:hypothetical protein